MTNEEKILERLERLEEKITPIAESAASIKELKEELTPRLNEGVQALIVGLADRYDALRSRRPYKDAYPHEKSLAVLEKDDRSGINAGQWYGEKIWHVFEKHHLRFKEMFEGMQN